MIKPHDHRRIRAFCKRMKITHYTIGDDGTVDTDQSVVLEKLPNGEIPIQFGKVTGSFKCLGNSLTSLKGSPHTVSFNFICSSNLLTSLEYGPKYVGMNYVIINNPLLDLRHAPEFLGGFLYPSNYLLGNDDYFDPLFELNYDLEQIITTSAYDIYARYRIWTLKNIIMHSIEDTGKYN